MGDSNRPNIHVVESVARSTSLKQKKVRSELYWYSSLEATKIRRASLCFGPPLKTTWCSLLTVLLRSVHRHLRRSSDVSARKSKACFEPALTTSLFEMKPGRNDLMHTRLSAKSSTTSDCRSLLVRSTRHYASLSMRTEKLLGEGECARSRSLEVEG